MSSKCIHLTPKKHSLNPLHRIILGAAKLLQTINRDVSQPWAKRNPCSSPLWNMITWEFSPNNNGSTPTQATLNLSLQTLHVQTIYSHSHGTVQIFPISTQGSHCWAPPLSLDILVSTRDLPTLVPVAQVGGNSSNCPQIATNRATEALTSHLHRAQLPLRKDIPYWSSNLSPSWALVAADNPSTNRTQLPSTDKDLSSFKCSILLTDGIYRSGMNTNTLNPSWRRIFFHKKQVKRQLHKRCHAE